MIKDQDKEISEGVKQRFLQAMDEIIDKRINGISTQVQFGEVVGEFQQNFNRMRKGSRYPAIRSLVKLCTEFGCSVEWLFIGKGEPFKTLTTTQEIQNDVDELKKGMSILEKKVETLAKALASKEK